MFRKLQASFEETNLGLVLFLLGVIGPIVGVMAHCGYNIYLGNALETYDLIIMDHPVLTNLGVSYLEVLLADVAVLIALGVGLAFRYYHYKDERDFIKKYNLKRNTGFYSDFSSKSSLDSRSYDSCDNE